MNLAPGDRVAGYVIERLVARGGMGVVYLARDARLGRPVALKLLAPELADDVLFRERFVSESERAAAIDHPHIIPIYEAGETEGRLYIAMRYVDGADLASVLRRDGRLPVRLGVLIASQVGSALEAAHERGLVHRDVKPANILLAATGRAGRVHSYLVDFGLTKPSVASGGFTRTGQIVGTLEYMAPEQITGSDLDGRTDEYSLGCVLFEALTGGPPFTAVNPVAMLFSHVSQPAPRLRERDPSLPETLEQVVLQAMAKRPEDRYQSVGAFVEAAEDAVEMPSVASRPEGTSSPSAPAEPPTQLVEPRLSVAPPLSTEDAPSGSPKAEMLPLSALQVRMRELCEAGAAVVAPSEFRSRLLAIHRQIAGPLIVAVLGSNASRRASIVSRLRALEIDALDVVQVDGAREQGAELEDLGDADAFLIVADEGPEPLTVAGVVSKLRRSGAIHPVNTLVLALHQGSIDGASFESLSLPVLHVPVGTAEQDPDWEVVADRVRTDMVSRRPALKAEVAVRRLEKCLGLVATDDQQAAAEIIRDGLEEVALESHDLAELRLLAEVRAGSVQLPAHLRADLERLLSASDRPSRLGQPADASEEVLRQAAEAGASRWQTFLASGRTAYRARDVGETATRAYNRLWVGDQVVEA